MSSNINFINKFIYTYNPSVHYINPDLKVVETNSLSSRIKGLFAGSQMISPIELFKKVESILMTSGIGFISPCNLETFKNKLIKYAELVAPSRQTKQKAGPERSQLFERLYRIIDFIDGRFTEESIESGFVFLESNEEALLEEQPTAKVAFKEMVKVRFIPMNNLKNRAENEYQLLLYFIHHFDPNSHILVANADRTDIEIRSRKEQNSSSLSAIKVILKCLIPGAVNFLQIEDIKKLKEMLTLLIEEAKKSFPASQSKLENAMEVIWLL